MTDETAAAPETVIVPAAIAGTPPRRRHCAAIWLLSLVAFFLAIAALLPWVAPNLAARTPFARTLVVAAPLPVQAVPAPAPEPAAAVPADADKRLVAAEAMVAALQTRLDTINGTVAAQAQQITAQADKTATMESAVRTQSVNAALAALQPLLSLQRISARLDMGAAYETDLAAITPKLLENETAALAPLARGGISTTALADDIDNRARSLAATYREAMATTWWEKIKVRLSSLIYIKTTDSDADDMVANGLVAISTQVRHGDTEGALGAINALPDSVKAGLADTATALRQRQAAVEAVNMASARLTAPAAD